MKVFKIWIDAPEEGDFKQAIVIAANAQEARETHPNGICADEEGFFYRGVFKLTGNHGWALDSRDVNVEYLGESIRYIERQVIGTK